METGIVKVFKDVKPDAGPENFQIGPGGLPWNILREWFYNRNGTHRALFDETANVKPRPDQAVHYVLEEAGVPIALCMSFPEFLVKKQEKNRVWHAVYSRPDLAAGRSLELLHLALKDFPDRVQWIYRHAWDRGKGDDLKEVYESAGFSCEEEIWWYEATPETYRNQCLLHEMDDGLTFEIRDWGLDALIEEELPDAAFRSWSSFYKREGHTPETAVCGLARDGGKIVGMDWAMVSKTCADDMFDGCLDWRRRLGENGALLRSAWVNPDYRGRRVVDRIGELFAERFFNEMKMDVLATETSSLNLASQKPNERYGMRKTDVVRYNLFKRDDSK